MDTNYRDYTVDISKPKTKHSLKNTLAQLSSFERMVAGVFVLLIVVSGTYLAHNANKGTFVEIPRTGGTYIEGIVGTPRFINPLLANSKADKDLTTLIYAGLMTRNAEGVLVPELAESYTISEDGTVYTFTLRHNLTFHDSTPLTAEDVVFTIEQAATVAMRSPIFANWDGVQVEQVDDRTVTFTLPEPYMPFIENTMLGILPKHIWNGLSAEEFQFSQFNITPVGSGPYKVEAVERDRSGIPTKYRLAASEEYALGAPHISVIEFQLFNNESDALAAYTFGEISATSGIAPIHLEELMNTAAKPNTAIHRAPLLRTFGVFFNHNRQPIFLNDEVREALEEATPKKAIVGEILRGYGTVLDTPLPPYVLDTLLEGVENTISAEDSDQEPEEDVATTTEKQLVNHIERARNILEEEGWERENGDGTYIYEGRESTTRLAITLATVNTPELARAAERMVESWREVGIEVELKKFEPTDLTQSIIRPRRFDALLFGMVIGHELDLYAFWHSSQRNDPGLNIAQYADIEADALLEDMRTETDPAVRAQLYHDFITLVQDQFVAIFLYAPDFVYVVNEEVHNVSMHSISEPHERFDTIHEWYIKTDRVWPFVPNFLK